jgi:hypothetical protein
MFANYVLGKYSGIYMSDMAGTFLAASVNGRWSIGLGDRSALGWVTVVVYFLAALCMGVAARKAGPGRRYWIAMMPTLVFLGACKLFDLPGFFTDAFRQGFMQSEIGEFHGMAQRIVTVGLLLAGVVGIAVTFYFLWRLSWAIKLALAAVVYLIAFIVIRAISLHAVDHLLGIQVLGVKVNHVLELGGLALVVIPAMMQIANAGLESNR